MSSRSSRDRTAGDRDVQIIEQRQALPSPGRICGVGHCRAAASSSDRLNAKALGNPNRHREIILALLLIIGRQPVVCRVPFGLGETVAPRTPEVTKDVKTVLEQTVGPERLWSQRARWQPLQ